MEIVIATGNDHKLQEIRKILPESFKISGMKEIGCFDEIPETGTTFEANALLKARYLFQKYGIACLADDSGLEVHALDGRPGVYSARYAGPDATSSANISKLLDELKGISDRKARFKTVLALIFNGVEQLFEGTIDGVITEMPSGNAGFGYDPVFQPLGYTKTFADMTPEEKNHISHRAIALEKLKNSMVI